MRNGTRRSLGILCMALTFFQYLITLLTSFLGRRVHGDDDVTEGEEIREGFEPADTPASQVPEFAIGDDEDSSGEAERTEHPVSYGTLGDERNVWDSPGRRG